MPKIQDTVIFSLKNLYNNNVKTIVNINTTMKEKLENNLKNNLTNVKKIYKLDSNYIYTPIETENTIQTNYNNGLYNGSSLGNSFQEVFSNYKSERKMLFDKKRQDIQIIEEIGKKTVEELKSQFLPIINQYKESQMNNINTINNTRKSIKGSSHVQLSKYITHKNTEIQSNLTDLYTEYSNKETTMVGDGYCCCLTPDDVGGICYSNTCGGKGYDGSGAEGCCNNTVIYDPETACCCNHTQYMYYLCENGDSYYYTCNMQLENCVVEDSSCTNGFKWAAWCAGGGTSGGGRKQFCDAEFSTWIDYGTSDNAGTDTGINTYKYSSKTIDPGVTSLDCQNYCG
jgi:hypothetical protein